MLSAISGRYGELQLESALASLLQSVTTSDACTNPEFRANGDTAPQGPGGPSNNSLEATHLEDTAGRFLASYSTRPDWNQTISLTNEYGQTLLHISVALGYHSLLQRLVDWNIDLDLQDVTGTTALHLAYLHDRADSITTLVHSGASALLQDHLGRIPSDLKSDIQNWIVSKDERLCISTEMQADEGLEIQVSSQELRAKSLFVQQWVEEKNRSSPLDPNV